MVKTGWLRCGTLAFGIVARNVRGADCCVVALALVVCSILDADQRPFVRFSQLSAVPWSKKAVEGHVYTAQV